MSLVIGRGPGRHGDTAYMTDDKFSIANFQSFQSLKVSQRTDAPEKVKCTQAAARLFSKIPGASLPSSVVMRHTKVILAVLFIGCSMARAASTNYAALHHAAQLRDQGDFKLAAAVLDAALQSTNLPSAERKQLEFQRDVLHRIKNDYSLSKEALFHKLSASLKDASRPEFERWIAEGRFDAKLIDGQIWFVDVSVRNLFFRYPELNSRRLDGTDDAPEQTRRLEIARAIKQSALQQLTPYVLPHHFVCTMTVSAAKGAAPSGEIVRAWLPVPRRYPFQDEFNLLSSSPQFTSLAPETSPIRSVFLEQPAQSDGSATFEITYAYTASGVYFDLKPDKIRPADLSDPALAPFLRQAPHVVFTDKITTLARQLAGGQTNPMLRARAFYDWIGGNIKYSFAREYSTLDDLSDYCLSHRYGDCGQEALLFITLCRAQGIPARWQSAWNIFPGAKDIHDWSEIYLQPYGWVPVDPWAGLFATQYCSALTPAERRELHDFYFGGLDYYRMAANSDHCQTLAPPNSPSAPTTSISNAANWSGVAAISTSTNTLINSTSRN